VSRRTSDEIRESLTQEFITRLENGVIPWRKPWTVDGIMPSNYFSKRPYRGINSIWLGMIQQARGYSSPWWTTANAAIKQGHYPVKGEKASYAILWKRFTKEDRDTGKEKQFLLLTEFAIFNIEQIDGLEPHATVPRPVLKVPDALAQIRDTYPDAPSLTHEPQDRAYYSPAMDAISLPLTSQFESEIGYAETFCHEHVHSTGHPKRNHRFDLGYSCQSDYAKEELVAEIGAAMLMQHVGLTPDMDGMAGYVGSWLKALKDDHSLIVSAAGQAQKAVDHITGYTYEQEEAA